MSPHLHPRLYRPLDPGDAVLEHEAVLGARGVGEPPGSHQEDVRTWLAPPHLRVITPEHLIIIIIIIIIITSIIMTLPCD